VATDSRNDIINIGPVVTVDLTANGPLADQHALVLGALADLGAKVPAAQWCLIGGLMVELLVTSRGGAMLRPTDDGDIVGDVVADRGALRKLANALVDLGFESLPGGWDGEVGVRFRHRDSGVFIDILTPANTARLRDVLPARPNASSLEAPGTDFAMATASLWEVTYLSGAAPLKVRVPSIAGGIYAKASAWKRIRNSDLPHKHLQDAAALLTVATLPELVNVSKAFAKRLGWLQDALLDPLSPGWEYVSSLARSDAAARLDAAVTHPPSR